jgi:hypothetical protein
LSDRPVTIRYLVMELLEGETLATRLTRGAVPIEEALQYAVQIASALDRGCLTPSWPAQALTT